jgi:hypothetical protein
MSETLKDIRNQVKDDLGLGQADWVDNDVLDVYIRRAVRKAHREIMKTYEDYFLSTSPVELLGATTHLEYPGDCYANKIRTIIFTNAPIGASGTYVIEIKKFKSISSTVVGNIFNIDNNQSYKTRWIPITSTEDISDGAGGTYKSPVNRMELMPSATTDDGHVEIRYIRKPIDLVKDEDVCDIPEFTDYVVAKTKALYYADDGDQNYIIADKEAKEIWKDMVDTLSNMVLDEDTEILLDTGFYEDSIA